MGEAIPYDPANQKGSVAWLKAKAAAAALPIPNAKKGSPEAKGPMTAVGQADVVMMQYALWIGHIDDGGDAEMLAHTHSFMEGVSLSEIKWGFINTANYGDKTDANISFTLHDIAGAMLDTFIKIKTGSYWIYFQGPMSDGNMWGGKPAIYYPIQDDCKIEFSATQGFTYSFGGMPMLMQPKSDFMANVSEFTINGDMKPGIQFWDYLKSEFQDKWNLARNEDDTKGCSQNLTVKLLQGNIGGHLWKKDAIRLEKTTESVKTIEPFKVGVGVTLSTAITNFFNTVFLDEKIKHLRPTLDINLKQTKKGVVEIYINIWTKDDEKAISTEFVCIGGDNVCAGAAFRGQLVSMDFGPLNTLMAADKIMESEETAGTGKGSTKTKAVCRPKDRSVGDHIKDTKNTLASNYKDAASGQWAGIETVLNNTKLPGFSVDIELPYSFGFTPSEHGGLLKDGIKGATSSGIHLTQGVELDFYWYKDPDCAEFVKVKGVSTKYRLAKVIHSVGLNGNTTQLTLAHLHITD